jgi:hypothetical protein
MYWHCARQSLSDASPDASMHQTKYDTGLHSYRCSLVVTTQTSPWMRGIGGLLAELAEPRAFSRSNLNATIGGGSYDIAAEARLLDLITARVPVLRNNTGEQS